MVTSWRDVRLKCKFIIEIITTCDYLGGLFLSLQWRCIDTGDHLLLCRSLFEKDKLLFAFLLCSRILESKGQIKAEDWMFLLTGGLGTTPDKPNPASDWLVERWVSSVQIVCQILCNLCGPRVVHELVAALPLGIHS